MQKRFWRVGRYIKADKVRVIDEDGKQIGILPLSEALRIAEEKGLDLVEIAPDADPPVCKIVDFGKFLYEQKKKEKEIRKSQKTIEVKEMQFSPKIQEHDIEIKARKIREWMTENSTRVKLVVKAKGREALHQEVMKSVIDKVMKHLEDIAELEKPPYKEGRNIVAIAAPKRKQ
jgi:translation initiation factor IF-3